MTDTKTDKATEDELRAEIKELKLDREALVDSIIKTHQIAPRYPWHPTESDLRPEPTPITYDELRERVKAFTREADRYQMGWEAAQVNIDLAQDEIATQANRIEELEESRSIAVELASINGADADILRAENEALQARIAEQSEMYRSLQQSYEDVWARAERAEALRQDAERYRWLRDKRISGGTLPTLAYFSGDQLKLCDRRCSDVDAAIDEARRKGC